MEFIITFDLSAVSPRDRPDCNVGVERERERERKVAVRVSKRERETGWRESRLHFPGFISSPATVDRPVEV